MRPFTNGVGQPAADAARSSAPPDVLEEKALDSRIEHFSSEYVPDFASYADLKLTRA